MNQATGQRARIIVFGNEKGGAGKSTAAMHVAVGLMNAGYRVATIDLDARQGSLTRYLANRFDYITRHKVSLDSPVHVPIDKSVADHRLDREAEDKQNLTAVLDELKRAVDFIVIDTPGAESYLSLMAHAMADIVVSPLNDSFIDLDVLARIDHATKHIKGPSIYTKIIEQTRSFRPQLRWIVMRNRLSMLRSKNKNEMSYYLNKLSTLFGFELSSGFSERVIFRDLFQDGLTLLDLSARIGQKLSMSEISGRQEVRGLIQQILEDPQTQLHREFVNDI